MMKESNENNNQRVYCKEDQEKSNGGKSGDLQHYC